MFADELAAGGLDLPAKTIPLRESDARARQPLFETLHSLKRRRAVSAGRVVKIDRQQAVIGTADAVAVIQVHAVRPERDPREIQFPRVEGYRVELPRERLT